MRSPTAALKQIHKRFYTRCSFWSLVFSLSIMFDELLKEGYLFNPQDLFNNPLSGYAYLTHEQLFACTILITFLCLRKARICGWRC